MTPPMHSPDDIQYALEMTKVLREPESIFERCVRLRWKFRSKTL